MKLLYVLTAVLALTLAEEEKQGLKTIENIEDLEAEASNVEILKEGADLVESASNYGWGQATPEVQPKHYWVNPVPVHHHTTPVPIIKNEIYYGNHGDYRYEYKTGDGTHVGEQGWFTDPHKSDSSLVKKGWYSYIGPDGRTYTVTYWADHTGYHAYGSHLPSPNRPHYPTQAITPRPITPKPVYTTQPPIYYPTTPIPTYPLKPVYPIYQPAYYPTQPPTYYPYQQASYN